MRAEPAGRVAGDRLPARTAPDQRTPAQPRSARIVAAVIAKRAGRSGALWGSVFGAYVVASAYGYAKTYPTLISRQAFATSLSSNAGFAAIIGPARALDTVAGFATWRSLGVLGIVGAVWGLLLATRQLRGEEELGRWELFLSGQVTRRGATGQGVAGLAVGVGSLWLVTTILTVLGGLPPKVGFPVGGSVYFATGVVAAAAMFVAVGILVSQLASTRRQANLAGAAVLGGAYLLRMVADSTSGLAWLRWVSPLGWPEQLHPLTGAAPFAFVPIALLTALASTAGIYLAGRRDLGAGVLPAADERSARTVLLTGSAGLTVRVGWQVGLAWVGCLAVLGLVLGLVAQSASTAWNSSQLVVRYIHRLHLTGGGAAIFLGFTFLIAAALVALAAAGQVAADRREEADGFVDHLVVRPVGRARWLGGRLGWAAGVVVAAGLVAAVAAWAGAASQHSGTGLGELLKAGLNIIPPALFVLGAGTLVFGLWPRAAAAVAYGIVAWSFLVAFVGPVLTSNRLVLDSSLFHQMPAVPAAPADWTTSLWMTGLGLAGAIVGTFAFRRRDLAGA